MPNDRRVVQVESLYREVRSVLEQARASAYRAVNFAMVRTYWQIGRLIVEHEQSGRKRAAYGEAVLQALSRKLTSEFGRGFDARNLRYMRQFFLVFPIDHALRDESESGEKRNALRSESGVPAKRNALRSKSSSAMKRDAPGLESGLPDAAPSLRPELSWTHYRLLLGVEDPQHVEDDGFEWVAIKSRHRSHPGMFVAQVVCKSMEPAIPDGSYCLFTAPVAGTRQGKTVLVQLRDATDPESGERYTVKRYESEKTKDGDSWRHARITLKPVNSDFEPIVLTGTEEGQVQVIAECVDVLGGGS